jgi:hypothetical protein
LVKCNQRLKILNNSVNEKLPRRGVEDLRRCARELLHLELQRQYSSVRPDYRKRDIEAYDTDCATF